MAALILGPLTRYFQVLTANEDGFAAGVWGCLESAATSRHWVTVDSAAFTLDPGLSEMGNLFFFFSSSFSHSQVMSVVGLSRSIRGAFRSYPRAILDSSSLSTSYLSQVTRNRHYLVRWHHISAGRKGELDAALYWQDERSTNCPPTPLAASRV